MPGRSTIRGLRELSPSLRGAALLPLAALLVHQGRYALAFGDDAGARLAAEGHGYLGLVAAVAIALVAVALGGFLGRVAQARRGAAADVARGDGPVRLWLAAAGALTLIYGAQELLEGAIATGHPAGIDGVLGDGGWLALPLALIAGGAIALLLRGADAVLALVRSVVRPARPRARRLVARWPAFTPGRRLAPLATANAGRAPPRASTPRRA